MPTPTAKTKGFSVKAYAGDAKTLLAFNMKDRDSAKNLAGFTIHCQPDGQDPFYILNTLRFKTPGSHTQDSTEPPNSSINAPIHKFRWLHVAGSFHGSTTPFFGQYTYTVTPRFFDDSGSLKPIDNSLSAAVKLNVGPFKKNGISLGFTRGFTQSQAFVHHFGLKALIQPKSHDLIWNTSQVSGTNSEGKKYTFKDEFDWLGFTARSRIFEILNEVLNDESKTLDVFAYDLNEPDVMNSLVQLGAQGRVRIILDNAALHHSGPAKSKSKPKSKASAKGKVSGKDKPKPEDLFEQLFNKKAKDPAQCLRGHFGRYSHDKVLIVKNKTGAVKVLTGSTNLSATGLYVNSNHVIVFEDPVVAGQYAEVFEESWKDKASKAFSKSALATQTFSFGSAQIPKTEIAFSPHPEVFANKVLSGIVDRINVEAKQDGGSVLFAVMQVDAKSTGPVFPALRAIHQKQQIFSYGITDTTDGIALYRPGQKTGVLVTGKPARTKLPPPFDQVPGIGGVGHQVHHKFVVCGFNGKNPVVYCGSSNLALGGEQANGDNLLAIHDGDVATVFAIEALGLVDHFDFLDRSSAPAAKGKGAKQKFASQSQAADSAEWFLSTDDKWVNPYFDPKDLHCVDRELFSGEN